LTDVKLSGNGNTACCSYVCLRTMSPVSRTPSRLLDRGCFLPGTIKSTSHRKRGM